jgi:hypothetical protein
MFAHALRFTGRRRSLLRLKYFVRAEIWTVKNK